MKHFIRDMRHVWARLQHEKVAKWTLIIHIVYYGHASLAHYLPTLNLPSAHFATSLACTVILIAELATSSEAKRSARHGETEA